MLIYLLVTYLTWNILDTNVSVLIHHFTDAATSQYGWMSDSIIKNMKQSVPEILVCSIDNGRLSLCTKINVKYN